MIELLTEAHADAIRPLFYNRNHLNYGVASLLSTGEGFHQAAYQFFVDSYLSGLQDFQAYGVIQDGTVVAMIGIYTSHDSPEWYVAQIFCQAVAAYHFAPLIHHVAKIQEALGRNRFIALGAPATHWFFTPDPGKQSRYEVVEEMTVPAKTRCFFNTYWQVLFNRALFPTDQPIRSWTLRPERRSRFIGGSM